MSPRDDAAQKEAIEAIAALIAEEKDTVTGAIEEEIRAYIASREPKDCLELAKIDARGDVTEVLPMKLESRYASALIAFVRKTTFEGVSLDSGLTRPVSALAADVFSAKLGDHADRISEQIIPLLLSSDRFISALSASLVESLSSPIPKVVQSKVSALLTSKLSAALAQTIDAGTTAAIKASVAKVAAASIASPIAVKISASLAVSLTTAIKPIILKLLASASFKAAIATKVKAIVVGALLAAFAKILGVKLGLTAGAAFAWILIPAVLGWLAYEYVHFPEKLAKNVSTSVSESMRNGFQDTSRSIAQSLVEGILASGVATLASHLVGEEAIQELLRESIADADG